MKIPAVKGVTDGVLRIRRIDLTDVDAIFAGVSASLESLSRWMPWAHDGYSRDDACWFVANAWLAWRHQAAYEFLIESASDGRFLGMCGLNAISREDGRANIGYWTTTGEYGKGVATTAARLVAKFGFVQLGLSRIRLFHAVDNIGSQRVAEKIGFVLEGIQRERMTINGTLHDAKLYAMIHPDEIIG